MRQSHLLTQQTEICLTGLDEGEKWDLDFRFQMNTIRVNELLSVQHEHSVKAGN